MIGLCPYNGFARNPHGPMSETLASWMVKESLLSIWLASFTVH